MIRQMIAIDAEKCDGCGLCIDACHEGAIVLENGKAVLLRDDFCDGLGNCLPACPQGAISFVEREALPFDEAAVLAAQSAAKPTAQKASPSGCPGSASRALSGGCPGQAARQLSKAEAKPQGESVPAASQSELRQWPVQIKLAPANAPYFDNAHLLIAADCTAYAYGNFHSEFIKNRITLIGCPKLDEGDYAEKLTAILKHNRIKSVTIARMSVPCCGGLLKSAIQALQECGKMIPWRVAVINPDGEMVDDAY